MVQKGERNYHPVARLKSFRVRNPKCDLGQGFCKTEKINNLPKVIQLRRREYVIKEAHTLHLPGFVLNPVYNKLWVFRKV